MLSNHRYCGVSWVVLVTMVCSFQPWVAMAGSSSGPASPATRQYTTIPSSTPAARSAAPNLVDTKRIPTTQAVITPPSIEQMNYDQLREAAVEAELNAQKAQILYNQAAAAYNMESSNIKAFAQKAGYAGLLHPPLSTPVTGPRWEGFDEVSNSQVRGGLVVTDGSIDVRPCNQILGITLPSWVGRKFFKTSDGKTFSSYSAAKDYVLKADLLKTPIQIGKTGQISQESIGNVYSACLDIEGMSANLDFSKKLIDKIALNDAVTWKPVIKEYSVATSKKQEAAQSWQSAGANLIDLTAKMILKAEVNDPKLEGLAIDAYGFLIASRLRYDYLTHYTSMPLSGSGIFNNLVIQKLFQDLSKGGPIDTSAYRTALTELYNFKDNPNGLLRLDRAFGFAAVYAASLKSQLTLTERVAQAAKATADKAAADKAASSKAANSSAWNLIGAIRNATSTKPSQGFDKAFSQTTTLAGANQAQLQVPTLPPSNPAMAALSDRATEVFLMLVVPVLDHTKIYGVTPSWTFVTNTAYQMDNYFFALKDQSKSAVVKNGGFDIYDKAAGWHKMQIEWHPPANFDPDHKGVFLKLFPSGGGATEAGPGYGSSLYSAAGVSELKEGKHAYYIATPTAGGYMLNPIPERYILGSYLAQSPLNEVLSFSAKEQKYWMSSTGYDGTVVSKLLPKFLTGVTNAFGISAATMLAAHSNSIPPYFYGTGYPDLRPWKSKADIFSSYVAVGLQADKAGGYPNGTFSKQMQNFSSVAALFHPISVGFGTCSIYKTLFSPYNPHLGYSCTDYGYPLMILDMSDKSSKKTSTLFRDLKRLNHWVADQIIPNAHAESIGIEKSTDSGGSSGGSSGGGSGGGEEIDLVETAKKVGQAAKDLWNYLTEPDKPVSAPVKPSEAEKTDADYIKLLDSAGKTIEKTLANVQQDASVVSDALKKFFGLPPIDWKGFAASNQDNKVDSQGNDLTNQAQAKSPEAGALANGDKSVLKTLNDRSITKPIDYNGKTYFPKEVNGVSHSQFTSFGGADWYAKKVSVTYVSPDGSTITEVDSFLIADIKGKDGKETTVNQGVYKIVIMEGSDTESAITTLHDLYITGPDGNIVMQANGHPAHVFSETLDGTLGTEGLQDTDPAAAKALQDQIDEWIKKHP